MQLTEEGQLNKPRLQRWLDEFGEHYSKLVMALSLAVAVLGPLLFKWPLIGSSGIFQWNFFFKIMESWNHGYCIFVQKNIFFLGI